MTLDNIHGIVFLSLAFLSVGFALAVVTTRKILRAAIYLMGVLAITGSFYLRLGYEFLAGVQILVYVGGIVVLIVFAIMLTSSLELLDDHPSVGRALLAFITSASFFIITVIVLITTEFDLQYPGPQAKTTAYELGLRLLDFESGGFVLPFEAVSLILISAVVGGIVVARKDEAPGEEGIESRPIAPKDQGIK